MVFIVKWLSHLLQFTLHLIRTVSKKVRTIVPFLCGQPSHKLKQQNNPTD